jgi:hypothetical protein
MTPVFCCGFECGYYSGSAAGLLDHWEYNGGTVSFTTTNPITGLRSFRSQSGGTVKSIWTWASGNYVILSFKIRFDTLPTNDCYLCWLPFTVDGGTATYSVGLGFNASDSKIYTAHWQVTGGVLTLGASGISVTSGVSYTLDLRLDVNANPILIDGKVDGSSLSQLSLAQAVFAWGSIMTLGCARWGGGAQSQDVYYDDFVISNTNADYPIGSQSIYHFIPTSDGTHNVAGANDFERGTLGTDIINSTTDSYLLVDDVPIDDTTPNTDDFINCVAPPNATDYTENKFGPGSGVSTPTTGPSAVDIIVAHHQVGTGLGSSAIKLNDNGTEDALVTLTNAAGVTTTRYARKQYAAMVGGGAWTAARFNNLRVRFGYSADANPDQCFDCAMIEAAFAPVITAPNRPNPLQTLQAVKRASVF